MKYSTLVNIFEVCKASLQSYKSILRILNNILFFINLKYI